MKTILISFLLFLTTLHAQSPEWSLYYSGDNSDIFSLTENYDGSIWFGNREGQLGKIDSTSNPIYQLPTDYPLYSIDCDQDSNIWIATQDTGLVKFDGIDFTFIEMRTVFTRYPNYNNVHYVKIDNGNNILLGTMYGLAIYDGNIWNAYDDANSPLEFWPDIFSLVTDDENNIWFASHYGAGRFDRGQNWQFWDELIYLSSSDIESDGTVWFVDQYGFRALRINEDSTSVMYGIECTPNSANQFAIDSSDVKWFSKFGGGGKVFAFDDQNFVELIISYPEIENHIVSTIYIDRSNTKWFGFSNGYIVKYTGDFPTNIDGGNDIIVSKFRLQQNYPNPFNPSTTIKFTINDLRFTTLKVFDVLGNEFAILVNEEKSAGSYEVEFNASSLPSGVYFYQLRAGNFVDTKKMVLLR